MEKKYYIVGGVLVAVAGILAFYKLRSLNKEIEKYSDTSGVAVKPNGELKNTPVAESGTTPEIDKTCKKYVVSTKKSNLNVRKTLGSTKPSDVEFGIPTKTIIFGRPSLSNSAWIEISKSNYKNECPTDQGDIRYVSAQFLLPA